MIQLDTSWSVSYTHLDVYKRQIVDSKTIRFGGSDINNALLRYVRECFGVIVSEEIIEDIKHTVGTAMAPLEDAEYAFQGRDMMNGCLLYTSTSCFILY